MVKVTSWVFTASLFLTTISAFAQIGGISGSKINSYCTDVVNVHEMEIEPSISFSRARYSFADNRTKTRLFRTNDSTMLSSGMRLRITYGILDNIEVGVSMPTDVSYANWGAKINVFKAGNIDLGLMAGLNTPFGTGTRSMVSRTSANTMQACIGAIGCISPSQDLSVDMNIQAGKYFKPLELESDHFYSLGADAGYFVFNGTLQLIAGFSYQRNFSGPAVQELWTLYPGITVETGRDFILVIHNSMDVAGRNLLKQSILDISVTITLR